MASLVGTHLPDIELQAHDGSTVNLAKHTGTTVLFCYPYTGRPGHPNPHSWDEIPGAHGSTPQALGFSALYNKFKPLHVKIFGLSFLLSEWQQEFASRHHLPFLLLSDEKQKFTKTLQLETFLAGTTNYLTRRSFVIISGIIRHDIYPVPNPERNAADMLAIITR